MRLHVAETSQRDALIRTEKALDGLVRELAVAGSPRSWEGQLANDLDEVLHDVDRCLTDFYDTDAEMPAMIADRLHDIIITNKGLPRVADAIDRLERIRDDLKNSLDGGLKSMSSCDFPWRRRG